MYYIYVLHLCTWYSLVHLCTWYSLVQSGTSGTVWYMYMVESGTVWYIYVHVHPCTTSMYMVQFTPAWIYGTIHPSVCSWYNPPLCIWLYTFFDTSQVVRPCILAPHSCAWTPAQRQLCCVPGKDVGLGYECVCVFVCVYVYACVCVQTGTLRPS